MRFKEWLNDVIGSDVDPMDIDEDSYDYLENIYHETFEIL